MKLKRIALLMMLVLVASVIAACGGDDDDGGDDADEDTSAEAQSGSELPQSITDSGITVSYPDGWVGIGSPVGVALASNQGALDSFLNGDEPNPTEGDVVVQVLTVSSDEGDPETLFATFPTEVSEDDPFAPGERSDVTIGDLSGLSAPLTFREGIDGEGALYLLTYDEATTLFVIAIAASGAFDEDLVSGIVQTVELADPDEMATEEPDDALDEDTEESEG